MSIPTRGAPAALGAAAALGALPGAVAAQAADPTAVLDSSAPVRALGSFLLVSLFGAGLLYWRGDLVERSVAASTERPLRSVLYGLVAYFLVALVGGSAASQAARLGVAAVSTAVALAVAAVVLAMASLGFAVVGGRLTALRGERLPRVGLAVGAAISALVVLVLPTTAGLLAWLLVAAAGLGGPVREFIHDERAVRTDATD